MMSGGTPLHPRQEMYALCSRIEGNDPTLVNVSLRDNQELNLAVLAQALSKNTKVHQMDLANSIPSTKMADFATFCQDGLRVNTSLKSLNLSDNVLGRTGSRYLQRGLQNHESVEQLSLHKSRLGDDGILALASGAPIVPSGAQPPSLAKNLKILELPCNSLTSRSGTPLKCLIRSQGTSLTQLDLHCNRLGDDGCAELSAGGFHSLRVLNLMANSIGVAGAEALGSALSKTNSINRNCGHDIVEASRLPIPSTSNTELNGLWELNLGHNMLGDAGAIALSRGLACCSLRILSLQRNQIGDEGATSLARALEQNKILQCLTLEKNQIGDDGAVALVKSCSSCSATDMKNCLRRPRIIYLQHNRVASKGAQLIIQILRETCTSRVGHLDLHFNRVDVRACHAIRFWTTLNQFGRIFLRSDFDENGAKILPLACWPILLAKARQRPEILHFMLTQKPDLCRPGCDPKD